MTPVRQWVSRNATFFLTNQTKTQPTT
uniref:Uncharacterized protein n=1 Tax=Rhizophora mucronata TaxID=61149 RepID=A0A2P2N3M6_RHIMU